MPVLNLMSSLICFVICFAFYGGYLENVAGIIRCFQTNTTRVLTFGREESSNNSS